MAQRVVQMDVKIRAKISGKEKKLTKNDDDGIHQTNSLASDKGRKSRSQLSTVLFMSSNLLVAVLDETDFIPCATFSWVEGLPNGC